jgi:putative addiction module component (TIGR02574 family)
MSLAAEKLAEALALPKEDRAFLARELIVSLDEGRDLSAETEWQRVIDRRTREMEEGKFSQRPMDQVLTAIRAKLNANRKTS